MKLQDLKKEIKYNVVQDFPNKGVKFIDFTSTFSSSVIMNEIAEYIGNYLYDNKLGDKIDYIIMPQSRGYIIGSFLSSNMNIDTIPVVKSGKLPDECILSKRMYNTEYSADSLSLPKFDLQGKNCFFVDDVFATGGTYECCKHMIESNGGILIGGMCLYDVEITDEYKDEVKSILKPKDII